MSDFAINNKAQLFDKWTNGNYNKSSDGNVEPFKAVDMEGDKPYNQALKDFSQEYINLFDVDKNGSLNFDEFMEMSCGELINQEMDFYKDYFNEEELAGIRQDLKEILTPMNKEYFDHLNLDEQTDEINAGEFATMLLMGDLDLEKYEQFGISSDSIDGNIDFAQYQTMSGDTTTKWVKQERQDFYNYFYAE